MLDLFLFIGYKTFQQMNGSLAQLEEHLVYTERVGSSNLSTPTSQEALQKCRVLFYLCKKRFELPREFGRFVTFFSKAAALCKKLTNSPPSLKNNHYFGCFFASGRCLNSHQSRSPAEMQGFCCMWKRGSNSLGSSVGL